MKLVRNHKRICLLLAMAIMIYGICLENISVNSIFSCNHLDTITSSTYSLMKDSVYRTETLSQREVVRSINFTRKNTFRNRNSVIENFVFSGDILPQNFYLHASEFEEALNSEISCSLSILRYIHEQDGEKA